MASTYTFGEDGLYVVHTVWSEPLHSQELANALTTEHIASVHTFQGEGTFVHSISVVPVHLSLDYFVKEVGFAKQDATSQCLFRAVEHVEPKSEQEILAINSKVAERQLYQIQKFGLTDNELSFMDVSRFAYSHNEAHRNAMLNSMASTSQDIGDPRVVMDISVDVIFGSNRQLGTADEMINPALHIALQNSIHQLPVEEIVESVDEPVVDQPIFDSPVFDGPVVDQPIVDEPMTGDVIVADPVF
jgi:hypothetical protein